MTLRRFIICISVLVSVGVLALVSIRHRHLAALRIERQARQVELSQEPDPSATAISATEQPAHTPSLELIRLRGEVARLGNRKRELAHARGENERLHVQLATKGTNAPGAVALPAGYIRKSEAKFAGYITPEDTLQSFLWAVQNREVANLLESFAPEAAKELEDQIQRRGSPKEFFDEANAMPGFHITEKKQLDDGSIELKMEILPGVDSRSIHFQQINGQWKIMGF